jgi:hypothetical protein
MNLLSKSILRITRKSAQETSYVGTNAVLRIVFGLILAYENSLECRSDQVSVPWVASSPGQGSPVAAALQRVLPGEAAAPPAPCPPEVARVPGVNYLGGSRQLRRRVPPLSPPAMAGGGDSEN